MGLTHTLGNTNGSTDKVFRPPSGGRELEPIQEMLAILSGPAKC